MRRGTIALTAITTSAASGSFSFTMLPQTSTGASANQTLRLSDIAEDVEAMVWHWKPEAFGVPARARQPPRALDSISR
jgi:hypothetical protein